MTSTKTMKRPEPTIDRSTKKYSHTKTDAVSPVVSPLPLTKQKLVASQKTFFYQTLGNASCE